MVLKKRSLTGRFMLHTLHLYAPSNVFSIVSFKVFAVEHISIFVWESFYVDNHLTVKEIR